MTEKTTRARKNLGESGERVAALFLEQQGFRIVERNWRSQTPRGEIDLIVEDANGLAFVEVRTRRGTAYGAPEESLTRRKRRTLIAVAQEYVAAHPQYHDCAWRIDLIAIELDRAGRLARMDHIPGAVEED